ncbi:ATP-dependent DNA ligase [Methanonatronarchaeum sp. AMET-Sl]|uniref:ATP-dependent DNA ligase n=1 Tax=Methanonatronarchaeum sp. AMET-Sl TaxID=3037654 RepID=UPI00244E0BC4|nr:ATP-dependent DNA ligase [Methanonatronarchaeum sp. AMET-Sl]WGI17622.1 ATP-dependent DNA ligase [Methanonatronarchaeum sp. AMET-Sl]
MSSLLFSDLIDVFLRLEETRSRNEMTDILVDLYEITPSSDVGIVSYLVLGQIDADYKDVKLGLGDKMVAESLSIASSRSKKEIQEMYREEGDLGTVAEKVSSSTKNLNQFLDEEKDLLVQEVYQGLKDISSFEGDGSHDRKIRRLAGLITQASGDGARFLTRIALGKLRLGVGAMTLLDALAKTYSGSDENRPEVEHAYNISSDIGLVAEKLSKNGLKGLNQIDVEVGRPIRMMLAQRLEKLEDIKDKIEGRFAAEVKYDGERMQIHKSGDNIQIFSRRLEDITNQYPDVVRSIRRSVGSEDVIIEGEAVATKDGELQDFQTLMQRKRKYDVEQYVEKIPVKLFLFDMLYKNKSLLNQPFSVRRKKLQQTIQTKDKLELSKLTTTQEISEVESFFQQAVDRGQEGIMLKSCGEDSVYRAGARDWQWIKWKKDYQTSMSDTVDLTVIGGFAGKGRRSGLYGTLLCAAYNKEKDIYQTVCKVGTGFTDQDLEQLPNLLQPHKTKRKPARVESDITPDQWIQPNIVVEILGAELTKSPVHTAARNKKDKKGIAIRFPRYIKLRQDKGPTDSTTTQELKQMYKKQKNN